jgi:hypothetical protein
MEGFPFLGKPKNLTLVSINWNKGFQSNKNPLFPAHTTITFRLRRPADWGQNLVNSGLTMANYRDETHTTPVAQRKPPGTVLLIKGAAIEAETVSFSCRRSVQNISRSNLIFSSWILRITTSWIYARTSRLVGAEERKNDPPIFDPWPKSRFDPLSRFRSKRG